MWSSGGGFDEHTFSSPTTENEKPQENRRAENLVPVAIHQIVKGEKELEIAGIPVNVITIVAMLKSENKTSTKVTYLLDDFTGQIEAVQWLDNKVDVVNLPINAYCRITGTIRSLQGKRHIMIFNIYLITDLNELTTHLLEVIDVHQNAPSLMDSNIPNSTPAMDSSVGIPFHNSLMNTSKVCLVGPSDPQHRMIYKIIEDAGVDNPGGVDIPFIAQKCKGMPEQQVKTLTEYLLNEGFIFSTIDEEHYTITANS